MIPFKPQWISEGKPAEFFAENHNAAIQNFEKVRRLNPNYVFLGTSFGALLHLNFLERVFGEKSEFQKRLGGFAFQSEENFKDFSYLKERVLDLHVAAVPEIRSGLFQGAHPSLFSSIETIKNLKKYLRIFISNVEKDETRETDPLKVVGEICGNEGFEKIEEKSENFVILQCAHEGLLKFYIHKVPESTAGSEGETKPENYRHFLMTKFLERLPNLKFQKEEMGDSENFQLNYKAVDFSECEELKKYLEYLENWEDFKDFQDFKDFKETVKLLNEGVWR